MRRLGRAVGALAAMASTLVVSAAQEAPAATGIAGGAQALTGALVPDLLILFGCVFLLAAAVGLVRFPDFYVRLHATTKLVTLGGIGIFGGAAIAFSAVEAAERVLLIAVFFFLTAPLSGYMIARSGYLRGLAPYREEASVDEWGALGSTSGEVPEADDAATPAGRGVRQGATPQR